MSSKAVAKKTRPSTEGRVLDIEDTLGDTEISSLIIKNGAGLLLLCGRVIQVHDDCQQGGDDPSGEPTRCAQFPGGAAIKPYD